MILKAKYDNHDCYINSDYIMDVFDLDKPEVKAYCIDFDRGAYLIKQDEFLRWKNESERREE